MITVYLIIFYITLITFILLPFTLKLKWKNVKEITYKERKEIFTFFLMWTGCIFICMMCIMFLMFLT